MGMGSKGRYALIALAAALGLGMMARNRTPADIRRFVYHPTLLDDAIEIATDPLQIGIIGGAMIGAVGMALIRAGDAAAQIPRPQPGLLLNIKDPAVLARASKAAEQATRQILDDSKN